MAVHDVSLLLTKDDLFISELSDFLSISDFVSIATEKLEKSSWGKNFVHVNIIGCLQVYLGFLWSHCFTLMSSQTKKNPKQNITKKKKKPPHLFSVEMNSKIRSVSFMDFCSWVIITGFWEKLSGHCKKKKKIEIIWWFGTDTQVVRWCLRCCSLICSRVKWSSA